MTNLTVNFLNINRTFAVYKNGTFNNATTSVYVRYRGPLVTMLAFVLVINFLGMLMNGVIFFATIHYPPLKRSSSRVLMAHCILLDFCVCLIGAPSQGLTTYFGYFIWPAWFCPTWGATLLCLGFVTNWAHSMLAINRFIATVFPLQYGRFTRLPFLMLAVAVPWIVTVVLNIFTLTNTGVHFEQTQPWGGCWYYPSAEIPSAIGNYIPVTLIGMCYVAVLVKARWSLAGQFGQDRGGRQTTLEKRYETAKVLFSCFLWYLATSYGLSVVIGMGIVAGPGTILAFKGLRYVTCAVNPVFFLVISKDYRKGSMSVLGYRTGAVVSDRSGTDKYELNPKLSNSANKDFSRST